MKHLRALLLAVLFLAASFFGVHAETVSSANSMIVYPVNGTLNELLAAKEVRRFGMVPRVALLSHSSFGSHVTESSKKMARTKELLAELAPELEVDGEMKGATALNAVTRQKSGKSTLSENANLLIMPNLDAANITYTVLKSMGTI